MRRILAATAATALGLAGCNDDNDQTAAVEAILEQYGDAPPNIADDVTLDECGYDEGAEEPFAAGTLTNSADLPVTYSIEVEGNVSIDIPADPNAPRVAGDGEVFGLEHFEAVGPGETVDWLVPLLWLGPPTLAVDYTVEVECGVTDVSGYTWLNTAGEG